MEHFIGNSSPNLRFKFRRDGGNNFTDRDWINFIWKVSNKTRFQCCRTHRLGQISSAEGQHSGHANSTRPLDILCSSGTPSAKPNLRRGPILQAGQDVQSRRQENHAEHRVTRERLLVLEALGQTEAERKYERAPPTAMQRGLQTFLEVLLKTEDHGKGTFRFACRRTVRRGTTPCTASTYSVWLAHAQRPKGEGEQRTSERPGTTV